MDNIVETVRTIDPGSKLCKTDIATAFRQLGIDAKDLELLGIKHNNKILEQQMIIAAS